MKKKILRKYIAGPMTLYAKTDWNAANFNAAASRVRAAGHVAVSPVELDISLWGFDSRKQHKLPPIMTRRRVLAFDIGVVIPTCDVIYLLKNWSKSSGARAELAAALTYGLKVEREPGAESTKGIKLDGTASTNGKAKGRAPKRRKATSTGRAKVTDNKRGRGAKLRGKRKRVRAR